MVSRVMQPAMILCVIGSRATNCRSPVKVVKGRLGRRLSRSGAGAQLKNESNARHPPKFPAPLAHPQKSVYLQLGHFNAKEFRQHHGHREPVQRLMR